MWKFVLSLTPSEKKKKKNIPRKGTLHERGQPDLSWSSVLGPHHPLGSTSCSIFLWWTWNELKHWMDPHFCQQPRTINTESTGIRVRARTCAPVHEGGREEAWQRVSLGRNRQCKMMMQCLLKEDPRIRPPAQQHCVQMRILNRRTSSPSPAELPGEGSPIRKANCAAAHLLQRGRHKSCASSQGAGGGRPLHWVSPGRWIHSLMPQPQPHRPRQTWGQPPWAKARYAKWCFTDCCSFRPGLAPVSFSVSH